MHRTSSSEKLTSHVFPKKPELGSRCKNTGALFLALSALSLLGMTAFLIARRFTPTMAKPFAASAGLSGAAAAVSLVAAGSFCALGKRQEKLAGHYAFYQDS